MARQFIQQAPVAPQADAADGYINVLVGLPDASHVKIGFCALRKSDATQAQLIEWLEAKEENASKLGAVLTFRYNSGAPKRRVALVLPE